MTGTLRGPDEPRVRRLGPDDAGNHGNHPGGRGVCEAFVRSRGKVPNLFRVAAQRPQIVEALRAHVLAVMGPGEVDARLKELLAVRVSCTKVDARDSRHPLIVRSPAHAAPSTSFWKESMRIIRRPAVPATLLLGVLAACNTDVTPPEARTFAYAEVQAVEDPETGEVSTRPFIALFKAANVSFPDSRAAGDQCGLALVPDPDEVPDPNIPTAFSYLEAGSSVTLNVSGGGGPRSLSRTAQSRQDGSVLFYGLPLTSGGFASNADVAFTVPGATGGFPAATIAGKTTVPFTLQTVPNTGTSGQTLPLRWTPPPTGHASAMLVELRYTGTVNSQPTSVGIYCSLVDDGSFDVPAALANEWFGSNATSHHVLFQRLLTTAKQETEFGSVVSSTYSVTKQTPPAAAN